MLKKDAVPNAKRSATREVALDENASIPMPPREVSLEEENARLQMRLNKQRIDLRNTRKCEVRLRRTVGSLIDDLEQQKFINAELKAQLDDFKGEVNL